MSKQRIDKIFSNLGILSRTECSKAVKCGDILVNGIRSTDPGFKVDPDVDVISYKGNVIDSRTFVYYMLNKPADCITANEDKYSKTVFDYIDDTRTDLSAVGRLDKDTTGILLITNDGDLNHRLLSPKYHVPKTYIAHIDGRLLPNDIELLEKGLDIGDEKPTMPASCRVLSENEDGTSNVELVITEGRFHQVKRMFETVGKPVITLHREKFGPLELDKNLMPGEYREVTAEELEKLNIDTGKNK